VGVRVFRAVLGALRTNSYLVVSGGECAVIDPPVPSLSASKLLREACRAGRAKVIATHNHFDHTGGVASVKRALGAELYIGREDLRLSPINEEWVRLAGLEGEFEPLPEPDRFLEDGEEIRVGETALEAYWTPGHTPGHFVFYLREKRALFTGDLIFRDGVGRCDLPYSSCEELAESLRRVRELFPEGTTTLPGHGPPGRLEAEG